MGGRGPSYAACGMRGLGRPWSGVPSGPCPRRRPSLRRCSGDPAYARTGVRPTSRTPSPVSPACPVRPFVGVARVCERSSALARRRRGSLRSLAWLSSVPRPGSVPGVPRALSPSRGVRPSAVVASDLRDSSRSTLVLGCGLGSAACLPRQCGVGEPPAVPPSVRPRYSGRAGGGAGAGAAHCTCGV